MKCFECGDVGHKRHACPHKEWENEGSVSRVETGDTPASVPTQGVRISNEAKASTMIVSDFRNIAVNDMNRDIAGSVNVESTDIYGLHSLPGTSGI